MKPPKPTEVFSVMDDGPDEERIRRRLEQLAAKRDAPPRDGLSNEMDALVEQLKAASKEPSSR
jgi:hypothetical protein